MTIFECIEKRRSVYPPAYNNQPIPKETLERILATANWAPTHRKTEPWRFHVFQQEAKMKLANEVIAQMKSANPDLGDFKLKKTVQKFEQSDTVIAIVLHRDPKDSLPEWEEVAAVAMAVQNMWLACTEEKIGAYWSSPSIISELGSFLDLAPNEKCLGFFYMGNTDEFPEGVRKSSIEEKVKWVK